MTLLRAITVAAALILAVAAQRDARADWLYWTDPRGIERANLDGSGVESVLPMLLDSAGITANVAAGKLYWTNILPIDVPPGVIQRANLDGSGVENVIPIGNLEAPTGIAVQPPSGGGAVGNVYWTDVVTNDIRQSSVDGLPMKVLVRGLANPYGIAVDAAGGKMYWTHTAAAPGVGAIQRADLDGSGVEGLVSGLNGPTTAIALDVPGGKMYWGYVDPNIDGLFAGKIMRSDLDGGNAHEIIGGMVFPAGIALDLSAGKIYWTDMGRPGPPGPTYPGRIGQANLDGSDARVIVEGLDSPRGLALVPEPATLISAAAGASILVAAALATCLARVCSSARLSS